MENDGQDSHPGEEDLDPTANVVHFPRDWFGPREELVALGPGAAADAGSGAGGNDSAADADAPAPVRADDFWDEGSASIQDAMQGPEPAAERRVAAVERRAAAVARRRPRLPRKRPTIIPGRRPLGVAGIGLAACALVASVLGSVWPVGIRAPQGARDAAGLSPAVIGTAPPPITLPSARARTRTGRARASRGHPARGHSAPTRARAHIEGRTAGSSVASSAEAANVQSGRTAPTSSAAPSSSSSAATGAIPTEPSSGSGGGGASGQPAGPAGPGAPFGPGHLG